MGEGSELVISEFRSSQSGNRLPGLSAQSKVWLAATAATILGAGYIYSESEIFSTARRGESLIKAGEQGRLLLINQLIAEGANADTVIGGWSPLTRSVLFGQVQAVELLLAAGANVNRQDRHVGSALYLAIATRRLDLAKKLLDYGADPNAAPEWGQTPLMVAATQGNADAARLLLERGADPARRSKEGKRASTLARDEGHVELAQLIERAEKP
jgi:ankyrin repeat protein